MKELKWALSALFKVLLFEMIVGTVANIMGVEYRPYRYLSGYYPKRSIDNGKIFL